MSDGHLTPSRLRRLAELHRATSMGDRSHPSEISYVCPICPDDGVQRGEIRPRYCAKHTPASGGIADGHNTPPQRHAVNNNHRDNYSRCLVREQKLLADLSELAVLVQLDPDVATRSALLDEVRRRLAKPGDIARVVAKPDPHAAFMIAGGIALGAFLHAIGGWFPASLTVLAYIAAGWILRPESAA